MCLFLLLLVLIAPLDGARILGTYHNAGRPPAPFNDPYARGPMESYGQPYHREQLTLNPNSTQAPKLYDREGNYRGRWSEDALDKDSIANPTSQYSKTYINPYEVLYIVEEEYNAGYDYPRYIPKKTIEIQIESGPVWSGPFWDHWRWRHPWD